MKHDIYLRLSVEHVDGPKHDLDAIGRAAVVVIEGETLELLTHPPTHRSRYLVDDAEVVGKEDVPTEAPS